MVGHFEGRTLKDTIKATFVGDPLFEDPFILVMSALEREVRRPDRAAAAGGFVHLQRGRGPCHAQRPEAKPEVSPQAVFNHRSFNRRKSHRRQFPPKRDKNGCFQPGCLMVS